MPALQMQKLTGLWRLARLYAVELEVLGGIRIARWFGVAVVSISITLLLLQGGRQAQTREVVGEALVWLSWLVGGVAAYASVRGWVRFQAPLGSLASERGVPPLLQQQAARLGLLLRLFVLMALPALAIVGAAILFSSELELALSRLPWLVLLPSYCLLLALGLSLLVPWCASFSQGHSQGSAATWLLAIVFGPHLLRELWSNTPSLIGLYAELLHHLLLLGGAQ